MKEGPVQVPASSLAPLKVASKAQEQQITASSRPAPTVENELSNSVTDNGNGQESECKKVLHVSISVFCIMS